MRVCRPLSVAALALAAGGALAPAPAAAATSTGSGSWIITVKTATYPTLQAERDRVMQKAADAGFSTAYVCTRDEQPCNETFLVSDVAYRTVVARFRYDDAIVSIEAAS